MPICAGSLSQLFDTDLIQAGWDPDFIGPRDQCSERYQFVLGHARQALLKKLSHEPNENENPKADEAALNLFLRNNEDCRELVVSPVSNDCSMVIEEVKVILDNFCNPDGLPLLGISNICAEFSVGKGANIGHAGVDFYSKVFCSPLTASSSALPVLYRHAVSDYPVWAAAEARRYKELGDRIVVGSALAFAPKNREISRVICTEPLCNMLFQKGIGRVIEGRMKQVMSIDLTTQPDKNAYLAQIGSVTDEYGTIDLSSASDRNSLAMVRAMFPPSFVRWLELTRSPYVTIPNGDAVELHMVSSMGNGFTFPLQTVLFAAVVVASYRYLGLRVERPRGKSLGNFAVFGDDIIVKKEAYSLVCAVLESLGHKVNVDKSFNTGRFRESCGSDWFSGHNVRGTYIKSLDDDCDIYSAVNRLNIWSAKHCVPLPNTVSYLLSCLKGKLLLVPMHETEVAGLRCGERWASKEASRIRRRKDEPPMRNDFGLRYAYLRVASYKVEFSDGEVYKGEIADAVKAVRAWKRCGVQNVSLEPSPKVLHLAKAWYNPEGHLLSITAGRLRDGSYVVREFSRRTVKRYRRSSCWDYGGPHSTERWSGRVIDAVGWNVVISNQIGA